MRASKAWKASTTWSRSCGALERRLDLDTGDLADLSGWAAKLPAQVGRLAGLLHLAEYDPDLPEPLNRPISGRTMAAACESGDYFVAHGVKVFGPGGERWTRARRLLSRLVSAGLTTFSVRDAWRQARTTSGGAFPDTDAVKAALSVLVDTGWVRQMKPEHSGPRGSRPPSPRYELHPQALTAE